MNLQFNIALHALTFLSKHEGESYSSTKLAELVCINSVQLRNVMRVLAANKYVISKHGKNGGYTAVEGIGDVKVSDIYHIFRHVATDNHIYTGSQDSPCKISKNMHEIMEDYAEVEYDLIAKFYEDIQIKDLLEQVREREADKQALLHA